MPTYQILRSFTVPRPEGGTYSKGIVVEMDDDEAAKYGKDVIPAVIDGESVVGAMPKKAYTKAELQALIDDAVAKARIEWESELAELQASCHPQAARLNQLKAMKLDDLRAIANDTEIENMHDLKKADLVTAIMGVEFPVEPKQEA